MSAAKPVVVYQYPKCSTCRKALKWLDAQGVTYESVDIVERPPSATALAKAMKLGDLELRRLFNTSGQSYRAGGWKDRLASTAKADALAALAADGKLIKRPLVLGDGVALVGFDADEWAAELL